MEEKNSICCVGVVEVAIYSTDDPKNEWRMRLGFGSVAHTEKAGEELQRKALSLTKKAVEQQPERYGFAPGEEIGYRTSINVLACEEIIGCRAEK